jgi:hypothetical protein
MYMSLTMPHNSHLMPGLTLGSWSPAGLPPWPAEGQPQGLGQLAEHSHTAPGTAPAAVHL